MITGILLLERAPLHWCVGDLNAPLVKSSGHPECKTGSIMEIAVIYIHFISHKLSFSFTLSRLLPTTSSYVQPGSRHVLARQPAAASGCISLTT